MSGDSKNGIFLLVVTKMSCVSPMRLILITSLTSLSTEKLWLVFSWYDIKGMSKLLSSYFMVSISTFLAGFILVGNVVIQNPCTTFQNYFGSFAFKFSSWRDSSINFSPCSQDVYQIRGIYCVEEVWSSLCRLIAMISHGFEVKILFLDISDINLWFWGNALKDTCMFLVVECYLALYVVWTESGECLAL